MVKFRFLRPDEVVQKGDHFKVKGDRYWTEVRLSIGFIVGNGSTMFRRALAKGENPTKQKIERSSTIIGRIRAH